MGRVVQSAHGVAERERRTEIMRTGVAPRQIRDSISGQSHPHLPQIPFNQRPFCFFLHQLLTRAQEDGVWGERNGVGEGRYLRRLPCDKRWVCPNTRVPAGCARRAVDWHSIPKVRALPLEPRGLVPQSANRRLFHFFG